MNYTKLYDSIINKSISECRERGERYYESHHIIPKCLGGSNDAINKVLLTGREHFICHKLLVKIHPNNYKLIKALECMLRTSKNQERYIASSKEFERIKIAAGRAHSKFLTGKPRTPFTEETKRRMRIAKTGRVGSNLGRKFSEEWRKNIGKASKGRNVGDKNHMKRLDIKERCPSLYTSTNNPSKNKKPCPYCNIMSGGINFKRWHGEACKNKLIYENRGDQ